MPWMAIQGGQGFSAAFRKAPRSAADMLSAVYQETVPVDASIRYAPLAGCPVLWQAVQERSRKWKEAFGNFAA